MKSIMIEKLYKRYLLRRVSPRCIPIIIRFIENIVDQLKASDETDASRNTEVINFNIDIRKINMPG